MDATCSYNRPAGQLRVPAAGTTPRPAVTPKGVGRPTSTPKGGDKGTTSGNANSAACYCYRCGEW
eukprot:2982657-Heterocapsa_arctica.AAC.1